jgi:3-hydroxymyristoyl/3-hydroxydecanoyl-(acyl carrier protein) dehydratase
MIENMDRPELLNKQISLDVAAVTRFLPHRDVMALLDGIESYWPHQRRLIAKKHVPMNEFSVQGYLPGSSWFPPTLLTEALAQACGIIMNMEALVRSGGDVWRFDDPAYRATLTEVPLSVLAESHIKHQRCAISGETIRLHTSVSMQRKEFHYFKVSATVGDDELAAGNILLSYPTYM